MPIQPVPVTNPNELEGPLDDLGAATKAIDDSILASAEQDDGATVSIEGGETGEGGQAPAQPSNQSVAPVVEGQPSTQNTPQTPAHLAHDNKNNLVDGQGHVIANAGRERRLYEDNVRNKTQLAQSAQQVQQLQHQVNEVKLLNNLPQQYGLDNEQVQQGLQLIKAYSSDPIGTLKFILTEAKAAGHNLDELVGPGTDMAAIGRMMDERLAPITNAHNAQVQSDKNIEAGNKLYQEFITRHVDATLHEETLAKMLEADPAVGLEAHYWRLRQWVTEKGLDWNKPLNAQAAQPVQQQSAHPTGAVMPSGATAPQTGPTVQESTIAPADMNTEDIVKQSMIEAGINFN